LFEYLISGLYLKIDLNVLQYNASFMNLDEPYTVLLEIGRQTGKIKMQVYSVFQQLYKEDQKMFFVTLLIITVEHCIL
jgi:hypothetical protein